jgi:hypothetical protein
MENKKMFDETLDNTDTNMVKLDNNEGKDTKMTHEHYWDTPTKAVDTLELDGKDYPVVAECACGESLLSTPF